MEACVAPPHSPLPPGANLCLSFNPRGYISVRRSKLCREAKTPACVSIEAGQAREFSRAFLLVCGAAGSLRQKKSKQQGASLKENRSSLPARSTRLASKTTKGQLISSSCPSSSCSCCCPTKKKASFSTPPRSLARPPPPPPPSCRRQR